MVIIMNNINSLKININTTQFTNPKIPFNVLKKNMFTLTQNHIMLKIANNGTFLSFPLAL